MPILLTLLIISLNCEREKAFYFEVFILPYNINVGLALSEVVSLTDPLLFCIYLYIYNMYILHIYMHVYNVFCTPPGKCCWILINQHFQGEY